MSSISVSMTISKESATGGILISVPNKKTGFFNSTDIFIPKDQVEWFLENVKKVFEAD